MRAESWWILWKFNFQIFVSMATGVRLTKISLTQINRPTPKTPYLVQESWWYLLYKLSNGRFCVQMTSACCHGNKGGSNRNLYDTLWLPDPENPQFGANISHVSLTVPELWLFKVTIGRKANFQILGLKGVIYFLTKPYKECACHQNASFKPLTAFIGPVGGPVAMRMKLKKPKTRNMGQSPTWGRPAPQVRLEIQFMGLIGRVKIWGPASPGAEI